MKPKSNRFLTRAIAPTLALISFTAIHAADIDTTGTTVALAPQIGNKYIGNGTLEVNAGLNVTLDDNGGAPTTEFAMTGGLIDIFSDTALQNGGWQKGIWTSNLAGMQVNGTFDIWDGNPVRIDALTGSGSITKNHSGNSPTSLTVGVNNGDGIFSGTITNASGTIALTKEGSGTQTLTGANTYSGATTVSAGTLMLQGDAFSNKARIYSISSGAVLNLDGTTNIATGTTSIGGTGTLLISGGSLSSGADGRDLTVELGNDALISIQSGASIVNGGWQSMTWTNNLSDMQVDGELDLNDGNPMIIDALTGSGTVTKKYWNPSSSDTRTLTVGKANGSGTFSGVITQANTIHITALTKEGSGTQILTGENNYSGGTTINGGTLQIGEDGTSGTLGTGPVTIGSGATLFINRSDDYSIPATQSISGAGSFTKSGAGKLTLAGNLSYKGNTTVLKGTLSLGDGTSNANLSDAAGVIIAAGTVLELNFTDEDIVGSLEINGSALPPGTYNSQDLEYGSYFTGSGSLIVPSAESSTWTSLIDGSWENSDNWLNNILADGAGKTATFAAATGVTVTLDSGRTIGNLVFAGSNYTLTGTTLTLAAAAPFISVAAGIDTRVETLIAGTSGLAKTGAGTLTLTAANTYTGPTTISEGTLISSKEFTNATAVTIASGASLRIDSARTDWPGGNSFSGAGTLIFNPGTGNTYDTGGYAGLTIQMAVGGQIQVQSGTVRQRWGYTHNWSSNSASMSIASGAAFDVWDGGNISIDALSGGGSIQKTGDGTNTTNVNIGQASGSGTFSGTISNAAGSINLIKNGSGTQSLTGTTNYNGSTTVNGGILSLGNGISSTGLPDAAAVNIANGAKIDLNFSGTDTVGSVNLGGTTYTTPGSYNAATYPDFFTGTGSLVIPGSDPFLSWIDATWPSLSDKNATGDPDHDGIANLVEYILKDGDPSASSTGTLPTLNATGTNFVFTYLRRAAATGATQSFEYSSTLDADSWTSVEIPGTGVTVTDEGNGIEKVEITVAKGTNAKLFGRLQVVK